MSKVMRTYVEGEKEEEIRLSQETNRIKDKAVNIYIESGSQASLDYLREAERKRDSNRKRIPVYKTTQISESENIKIYLHCPSCGFGFNHGVLNDGKVTGSIGGASAGAMLGAKIGIAMGPLGAIAGTVPGAILGGIFGNGLGNKFDLPRCPNCSTKFEIPNSIKNKNVRQETVKQELDYFIDIHIKSISFSEIIKIAEDHKLHGNGEVYIGISERLRLNMKPKASDKINNRK